MGELDPLVAAQRAREALTRMSDYSITSRQVRPLVAGYINVERSRQLLRRHNKTTDTRSQEALLKDSNLNV